MHRSRIFTHLKTASVVLASAGLLLVSAAPAQAAVVLDGPVGLGSAATFGVLGASTVTNTGPSVIEGNVGVSGGTAIEGFPPGIVVGGVFHSADAEAAQAQSDLTTAYNVAASLTPVQTGLGELAGLSLTPGVYSGGELSLNGDLTLAGSAESVWVFQAASTLTAGSSSRITMTGDASACNVFWQVGSSATLGSESQFVGTIMANASITAVTGADITGRLLADTGAVTLDSNVITAPTGCDAGSNEVSTSPTITSEAPPSATVGANYSFTATASGTPAPTFSVTTGALPAGLALDGATGVISGVPTTAGPSTFTLTVSNGTAPDATATYTLVTAPAAVVPPVTPVVPPAVPAVPAVPVAVAPPGAVVTPSAAPEKPVGSRESTLPNTGAELTVPLLAAGALLVLGGLVVVLRRRRLGSRD
ncbi:ice-binding family protein [Mycetocola sp. 2940]|uniref:ice-binding family protein n=1 Tax=Mycetocola sp. 2940 TaxID=3156452 RepID=UPI003397A1F0